MDYQSPSTSHAWYLSPRGWHARLVSSNLCRGYHQGLKYHHQLLDDRSCNLLFKLSLAEIVEFGIRDSKWGTFAWFRKHLIDIGPEADFIKILSSTLTKTKVVRKQPHGQHICHGYWSWHGFPKCVGSVATKPFSATYPSLFAMASPSSPAIVDVTCECIFVSFIIRIKFVFWCRSSESRYKRHRNSLQNYEKGWKLANYAC